MGGRPRERVRRARRRAHHASPRAAVLAAPRRQQPLQVGSLCQEPLVDPPKRRDRRRGGGSMTTEPLISVVVATYTLERLLDLYAAVDSVRSQTVQPLETIVVVDHNDDLLARARRE